MKIDAHDTSSFFASVRKSDMYRAISFVVMIYEMNLCEEDDMNEAVGAIVPN